MLKGFINLKKCEFLTKQKTFEKQFRSFLLADVDVLNLNKMVKKQYTGMKFNFYAVLFLFVLLSCLALSSLKQRLIIVIITEQTIAGADPFHPTAL